MVSSSIAIPFWGARLGNLTILAALIWWQAKAKETLPAERLISAMTTEVRYVRSAAKSMRRSSAQSPSSFRQRLPRLAAACGSQPGRDGAEIYGDLMATISVGSIVATFALGWLRTRLGANGQVALGTLGTASGSVCLPRRMSRCWRSSRARSAALPRRRTDGLLRLGAGGSAAMDARPGPGDFPHCLLRRVNAR